MSCSQDFILCIRCFTYNHSLFIEEAMNGFCMQKTCFPYLAVIIDDASTDGAQEVIKRYIRDKFDNTLASGYKAWETEEAYYIYARHCQNFNCYFCAIFLKTNYYSHEQDKELFIEEWEKSAKYVALCEGDDYWTDPLKLQKQYDILEAHQECAFCVHDYTEYLQNERRYREHHFPIPFLKEPGVVLDMEYYLTGPFFTKYLTAMYRKSAMDSCYFLKYDVSIDMAMFYALFTQGKAFLMTDVMGCYRMHDGGVYSGKDRYPLLRDFFSNIYSICREEGTKDAQRFVYGFLAPYALSELISQKGAFVRNCIKYLGVYGIKLLFYKIPQLIVTILLGKIGIKVKSDYLRI